MKKDFTMILFWFLLLMVVIAYTKFAYGEIRDIFYENRQKEYPIGPLGYNHWWVDMKGKGPSYDEHEKLANPVVAPLPIDKPKTKVAPVVKQDKPVVKNEPKQVFEKSTISLGGDVKVVACLNENNMTIHKPNNGNCYLGKGGRWKNIMLPPQSHIDQFKKIFGDDYKYRLAIANFEGSFRENAQNPYAIGYLQTLRSHKVKPDIVSQLNWLKNREDKNTGVACSKYIDEKFTLFGTMNVEAGKMAKYTCMARRHYGAFNPGDGKHYNHSVMYAKRYKIATEYYLSLDF